jgi:hypothetical protein
MTWPQIYTFLSLNFNERWTLFRKLYPHFENQKDTAGIAVWQQQEQQTDVACEAFAESLKWPEGLSADVMFASLTRLNEARQLADFVIQSAANVPLNHTAHNVKVPLNLKWLLIDYWHQIGLYRAMFAGTSI